MITFLYRYIFPLAFLAATGCDQMQDAMICTTPRAVNVSDVTGAKSSLEQMGVTNNCLHKWAYRLAKAPGSNREIAEAALGGCRDAIIFEANLVIKEQTGTVATAQLESSMFKQLRNRYADITLFHVVQARAGRCAIP